MAERITFKCACGAKLKVGAERAGSRCRCPECGAELTVPGGELLTVGDAGVQEVGADQAADAPRKGSCPTCGAKMADEAVICVKCGTNVETGERMGGGARDLLTVDERMAARQEADRVGFGSLVVGTLTRPVSTLSTLRWQLGFHDQLVKMSVFWLATLVVLGGLGALQMQVRDVVRVTSGAAPATTETRNRTIKGAIKGRKFHLSVMPGRLTAGQTTQVGITWKGEAPGKIAVGLIPYGSMPRPAEERELAPGGTVELTVPDCAQASLLLRHVVEDADDELQNFGIDVVHPEAQAEQVVKARPIALGALIEIGKALAALLLWTVMLGMGAQILAGRADWVPLLAVCAFLQGVTNLGWIPFLPFYAALGANIYLIDFAVRFWQIGLYYIAMMQLYDLDARNAVILVFVPGIVVAIVVFFITQSQLAL